jgi:hypothetical protein
VTSRHPRAPHPVPISQRHRLMSFTANGIDVFYSECKSRIKEFIPLATCARLVGVFAQCVADVADGDGKKSKIKIRTLSLIPRNEAHQHRPRQAARWPSAGREHDKGEAGTPPFSESSMCTERAVSLTLVLWAPPYLPLFIGGWISLKFALGGQRVATANKRSGEAFSAHRQCHSFAIAIAVGVFLNPKKSGRLHRIRFSAVPAGSRSTGAGTSKRDA